MTNMVETLVKNKIQQYEKENGEIPITEEDIFVEQAYYFNLKFYMG